MAKIIFVFDKTEAAVMHIEATLQHGIDKHGETIRVEYDNVDEAKALWLLTFASSNHGLHGRDVPELSLPASFNEHTAGTASTPRRPHSSNRLARGQE
jgi:hypothetical protein